MAVDAVIAGIEPQDRKYHKSPDDYNEIRKSSVAPPALGTFAPNPMSDETYLVHYHHLKGSPTIELYLPEPPIQFRHEYWSALYHPLIDRWEAEAASNEFRWGKFKKKIAVLFITHPKGHWMFTGRSTLFDAIEIELAVMEKREPVFSETRSKQIGRAVREMGSWGFIEVFSDESLEKFANDPDGIKRWLVVPTPMLMTTSQVIEYLFEIQEDEIAAADIKDKEKYNLPKTKTVVKDNSTYSDEFPYIKAIDPDARANQYKAADHYENRDVPRMVLPVHPVEDLQDQQFCHVVLKGFPRGKDLAIKAGSVHQVSEIISVSPLGHYANMESNARTDAVTCLQTEVNPTNGETIRPLIEMLTEEDQVAVLDFIRSYLSDDAEKELGKIMMKKNGSDILVEAIQLVRSRGMRRRYVIRQIQLLCAVILQDCLALWSGQIVASWQQGQETHD